MIYYVSIEEHQYTIMDWLRRYGPSERGEFRVKRYIQFRADAGRGTIILTDFDRLLASTREAAAGYFEWLQQAGFRILNHPVKSLMRYDLLKTLDNDFTVHRAVDLEHCRFPVFLRNEHGHFGSESDLIHDQEGLRKALDGEIENPLIVEFLDTRDSDGIFRKYSAFRIDDEIIPRHVLFSRDWEVKMPDIVTHQTVAEELAYIEKNPHQKELRGIFDTASIQYGRIDYSVFNDQIQVWEINTNPMLRIPEDSKHEMRREVQAMSAEMINMAFLKLDSSWEPATMETDRMCE